MQNQALAEPSKLLKKNQDQRIGINHISFLRAVIQGVDIVSAGQRYLSPQISKPAAKSTATWLITEILRTGRAQGQFERVAPLIRKAQSIKQRIATTTRNTESNTPTSTKQPSFEDWAKTIDIEQWGESEVIEMYQAYVADLPQAAPVTPSKVGRPAVSADERKTRLIGRQLLALDWGEKNIAKAPSRTDEPSGWIDEKAAAALASIGVNTLGELASFIQRKGKNWFRPIKSIGPSRAKEIEDWWTVNGDYLGALQAELSAASLSSSSVAVLRSDDENST
jgi:hypothetical protein